MAFEERREKKGHWSIDLRKSFFLRLAFFFRPVSFNGEKKNIFSVARILHLAWFQIYYTICALSRRVPALWNSLRTDGVEECFRGEITSGPVHTICKHHVARVSAPDNIHTSRVVPTSRSVSSRITMHGLFVLTRRSKTFRIQILPWKRHWKIRNVIDSLLRDDRPSTYESVENLY